MQPAVWMEPKALSVFLHLQLGYMTHVAVQTFRHVTVDVCQHRHDTVCAAGGSLAFTKPECFRSKEAQQK